MSEAHFRRDVIAALTAMGVHVTNHEDSYKAGIPDLSWAYRGRDGWTELKNVQLEHRRKAFKLGFSSEQKTWMYRRSIQSAAMILGLVRVSVAEERIVRFLWFKPAVIHEVWDTPYNLDWYLSAASFETQNLRAGLHLMVK